MVAALPPIVTWKGFDLVILRDIPVFSHESGDQSPFYLLAKVETIGRIFGWGDKELKCTACIRTTGQASRVFNELKDKYETFLEFQTALIDLYGLPKFPKLMPGDKNLGIAWAASNLKSIVALLPNFRPGSDDIGAWLKQVDSFGQIFEWCDWKKKTVAVWKVDTELTPMFRKAFYENKTFQEFSSALIVEFSRHESDIVRTCKLLTVRSTEDRDPETEREHKKLRRN